MDLFEKILTFISNFTNSIHSWSTIFSNLIAIVFVFVFRYSILAFYATLDGMNNTLSTILIGLSAITAYSLIFRSINAIVSFCSKAYEKRQLSINKKITEARICEDLRSLPKNEAALLKFLFLRHSKSAWLPPDSTEALLLLHKGYIEIISGKRKYVDPLNFYASDKDSLYKLTDNIIFLIDKHRESIMLAWKKIRIDKHLNKYQS